MNDNNMNKIENKQPDKVLICLKSGVIILGMILLMLLPILLILKLNKSNKIAENNSKKCEELTVDLASDISEFKSENGLVTILTSENKEDKSREIIVVDVKRTCPQIISKFKTKLNN